MDPKPSEKEEIEEELEKDAETKAPEETVGAGRETR